MKRSSMVKIVAVTSSVLLAGLYVYDRAGGNLLERVYPGASTKNEPRAMSSSKMKALVPAMQMQAEKQKLMPGPKYAPVFSEPAAPVEPLPQTHGPAQTDEPAQPQKPAQRTLMFPGSKSYIPIVPYPHVSMKSE